jgi:hypothetical protein
LLIQITIDTEKDSADLVSEILSALQPDSVERAAAAGYEYHPGRLAVVTIDPSKPSLDDAQPAEAAPKGGLTVEELKAGMTLKPTSTASLNDGSRVAVGDYVMIDDEKALIEATYRGTLIVTREDGTADVVKTEDCAAVAPEARGPRPGTAAALLGDQHPAAAKPAEAVSPAADDAVSPETAADLRERATNLIVGEKASVDEVMTEMNRVRPGCKVIEDMTAKQAADFGNWVKAKEEGKNPAFGF